MNNHPTEAPDETTPLISGATSHESHSNGKDAAEPTTGTINGSGQPAGSQEKPLPLLQILTLCYASLVEPIAYFTIFPFIPEMLNLTGGIAEKDIGFWSGLIESLFSLVQMVLMIFYGRAADRIGRKPVLVFSLAGVGVATAGFGMSKSLWQMLLFRCVAGTFAGSVVTIRTMLSEHTTKESQGRAFSWYMFARNLGIFLGSLIGIYHPTSDTFAPQWLTALQAVPLRTPHSSTLAPSAAFPSGRSTATSCRPSQRALSSYQLL